MPRVEFYRPSRLRSPIIESSSLVHSIREMNRENQEDARCNVEIECCDRGGGESNRALLEMAMLLVEAPLA